MPIPGLIFRYPLLETAFLWAAQLIPPKQDFSPTVAFPCAWLTAFLPSLNARPSTLILIYRLYLRWMPPSTSSMVSGCHGACQQVQATGPLFISMINTFYPVLGCIALMQAISTCEARSRLVYVCRHTHIYVYMYIYVYIYIYIYVCILSLPARTNTSRSS